MCTSTIVLNIYICMYTYLIICMHACACAYIYIYLDNCIYLAACMVVYTCFYSDINGGPPNSLINCMSRSCNGILHTLSDSGHPALSSSPFQTSYIGQHGDQGFWGDIPGTPRNQNKSKPLLPYAFICFHILCVYACIYSFTSSMGYKAMP